MRLSLTPVAFVVGMGVLLGAGSSPARAKARLTARVDRSRATPAQPIRLTLTLTSDRGLNHVEAPTLELSDFDVLGPSVSTRMEIVNGKTSFSRELVYTLYGRRTGRFRIGPARLQVDDQVLTTEPIDIEVVARRRTGGRAPRAPAAKAHEPSVDDVLFVRAVADHDTVYAGQQVIVNFDLCYRVDLRDVGFQEIPTFTGFWVKDLFVAQRLTPQTERIDGVDFNVAPLRRVALFPTRAGTQRVDPLVVTASIPQGRRRGSLFDALSLFDDPFFARGRSLLVRSPPLEIEVLPLPEAGRPSDFTGAVGRFELHVEAQPQQVRLGDPVTLRVQIAGSGNLQAMAAPKVAAPGFEAYDPTVEIEEGQTPEGEYGGRKRLEYILIAREGGRQRIPPLSVSFFDPEARRYRSLRSPAFDIEITAGLDTAAGPAYDLTRSEIEQLGHDIRHIKPDAQSLGAVQPIYQSPLYWLAHLLLPLAYSGFVVYERHLRRLQGDAAYARRRRARGEMTRRLRVARELVDGGEGFHAALQEAVVVYVADLLNRPPAGVTREVCRDLLTAAGVPTALVQDVDGLLERLEFARFAPAGDSAAARHRLLEEGEGLLERLREVLS